MINLPNAFFFASTLAARTTWYHSYSVNVPGTAYVAQLPGEGPVSPGTGQVPLALAVDGEHQLALCAFRYPDLKPTGGYQQYGFGDNNATGRIAVVDLKTGKSVGTVTGVEYPLYGAWNGRLDSHRERVVQLDPARPGPVGRTQATETRSSSSPNELIRCRPLSAGATAPADSGRCARRT
ncbi:hypothetical protein ACQPXS_37615 [Streptomyces sp. CA-142005]|uniref:hypothetical protein n=1 Tax=Streptomyces sp. CA-142005 TaxID=3240052 RepID=UPI003D92647C